MKSRARRLNRLTITYPNGRGSRGGKRTVVCTITTPQTLLAAEVDLADALISVLERRTTEPLIEA